MIFSAYQPFLTEALEKDGQEAYESYVDYLDKLPPLNLSKSEQDYIENISFAFDMQILKKINEDKINAVENIEEWIEKNKDTISQYENYKNSEEYQNSMMKQIQDKLQQFMIDNKYYEIAIPLIRTFSKSYNMYYENLLKASKFM